MLDAARDVEGEAERLGDWMPLGSARSEDNPVGGWYGLRKGYRGRFANYVPPVLEALERAEVEHKPRGNRMKAA